MPRPSRVFVEGGIYHVYNRVTRGEGVFGEDGEAVRLLDAMRDARDRDGLTVLAWCILGNHYHMAVRCGSVPLWRTMASIHTRVSRGWIGFLGSFQGGGWEDRREERATTSSDSIRRLPTSTSWGEAPRGSVRCSGPRPSCDGPWMRSSTPRRSCRGAGSSRRSFELARF